MSGPKRRELIPALQDMIAKACPIASSFAYETIALWSAGGSAETPVEKAVFQVIDEVVADMDAQAEAEPDLDDLEDEPVPARLQEALEASLASLWDLPIRTHGRRVGVIMQSGAATDEFLAEAIVGIRLGTKTNWTTDEVAAITAELQAEEARLDRWLTTWGSKIRRSS